MILTAREDHVVDHLHAGNWLLVCQTHTLQRYLHFLLGGLLCRILLTLLLLHHQPYAACGAGAHVCCEGHEKNAKTKYL